MRLHKHAGRYRDIKFGRELCDAFGLVFAAAVGKEDEWDRLGLEVRESFMGAGKGVGGAEEDAIDAEVCQ